MSDLFGSPPHFNGPEYVPRLDLERLTGQIRRVYNCMADGCWRSLDQIADQTGDPQASISAQLRHLRKERFGSHTVNKKRAGSPHQGLFVYQLIINQEGANANEGAKAPTLEEKIRTSEGFLSSLILAAAMKKMAALELNHRGQGNASIRSGEGLWITPTGGRGPAVCVPLSLHDRLSANLATPGGASTEWRMHLVIYVARPDIHAICHHHGKKDTAAAVSAPAPAGSEALAHSVVAALGDGAQGHPRHWRCWIPDHGMVLCGESMARLLEDLDEL